MDAVTSEDGEQPEERESSPAESQEAIARLRDEAARIRAIEEAYSTPRTLGESRLEDELRIQEEQARFREDERAVMDKQADLPLTVVKATSLDEGDAAVQAASDQPGAEVGAVDPEQMRLAVLQRVRGKQQEQTARRNSLLQEQASRAELLQSKARSTNTLNRV
jgi:hypothetical protein